LCILIDNAVARPKVRSCWGLSIVGVHAGRQFIFDVGPSISILRHNASVMGIDLRKMSFVVISHWHADHSGALSEFVKEFCPGCPVYVPRLTWGSVVPEDYIEVREGRKIAPGVYTTGCVPPLEFCEQALVIMTEVGACVLTGCSHPGLLKILEAAREVCGENVYAIIGGFHGFGSSEAEREAFMRFIRENGTELVCPCHCSGGAIIRFLERRMPEVLVEGGVGRVIRIPR